MIEVNKLIPKVYTESRDFSVFTGVMQIILNELDLRSRVLLDLPAEDLLLGNLSTYPEIKDSFRTLIKNKGTNQCILYAITLSGGELFSFDEEAEYLEGCGVTDSYIDRVVDDNGIIMGNSAIMKDKMVYYEKRNNGVYTMYVNVKDLGNINRGLLEELFYYLKPVNGIVVLEQAAIKNRRFHPFYQQEGIH